jgi:malonate-semialdehyde dehydrogenase (acetylating)/methylmalonate-semialdehyde dehydrogenase|tara:strand:- start:63 stop:359 length:297 start_codon:yes stop_codon:yes gene_type:complete
MNIIKNYVNGQIVGSSTDEQDVFDPSTGESISKVLLSNEKDFQSVIESSKKSQLSWSQTTPLKRSRIISKYKNLIENSLEELAQLISKEHGKTLEDAK